MSITSDKSLADLNSRQDLADYTGISVQTYARWAVEGRGPKFLKLGGSVRYTRESVLEWLSQAAA